MTMMMTYSKNIFSGKYWV